MNSGTNDPLPTPKDCYDELKSALVEVTRLIRTAPCNRAGLAVLIAGHFFAVAGSAMGKDAFANAREVADIIVEVMQSERPKLRVVAPDPAPPPASESVEVAGG